MAKLLIVNADDFGLNEAVNRGIVHGHQHGIITSASLMVRQSAAHQAAQLSRTCPRLSVGLHLDFGEWVFVHGDWLPLYQRVDLDDADALNAEVEHQLQLFRSLVGREPTHMDSHQHAHRNSPALEIVIDHAARLAVPLRHHSIAQYCGEFYGQTGEGVALHDAITLDGLSRIIQHIGAGITELCCHPAWPDPSAWTAEHTMYRHERATELAVLCDPAVPELLQRSGVTLVSFDEWPGIA